MRAMNEDEKCVRQQSPLLTLKCQVNILIRLFLRHNVLIKKSTFVRWSKMVATGSFAIKKNPAYENNQVHNNICNRLAKLFTKAFIHHVLIIIRVVEGIGAYPRYHRARVGVHPPWTDHQSSAGLIQRDKQPFALTSTPTENFDFPIHLTPLSACLWTVAGSLRTHAIMGRTCKF